MADAFLLLALLSFTVGVFLVAGVGWALMALALPLLFVGAALSDGKGVKWRS